MIRPLGRPGLFVALVVATALGLGGCDASTPQQAGSGASSPDASGADPSAAAEACTDVPDLVVRAVQQYVDGYGTAVSGPTSGPASSPTASPSVGPQGGDTGLRNALSQTRDVLQQRDCDVATYQRDLQARLGDVTARGPLAQTVLLRLKASLAGRAQESATSVDAGPDDDLPTVLSELGPGSTVTLAPGRYRLDSSLVLLQGVTLRGAGRGRTTLASDAGEVAVLVLTDGRVELADLTLRHTGRRAANGLIGGPTSSVVLTGVRVTGARSEKSGEASSGGAGVLMSGRDGNEGGRGTTLEMTGSELLDNSGAGVLLTGRHRVSIRSTRFERNGQCGICFTGRSSGAVRGGTFRDNAAGVAVLDAASPLVTGSTFRGGQVGVQASGTTTPVLRRLRVSGAKRAALLYAERAAGRLDEVTCTDVPFGIVVSPKALPLVGTTDCAVARSR